MNRDTYWACMFCGRECYGAEPATFICCGEIGHTEERDEETGEPVEDYQSAAIAASSQIRRHRPGSVAPSCRRQAGRR